MSIRLGKHGKISAYRAGEMLKANRKENAIQLRGISGWLQNKLKPDSSLRRLFGISAREQKL